MVYQERFGIKISAKFDLRRSNELTVTDSVLTLLQQEGWTR